MKIKVITLQKINGNIEEYAILEGDLLSVQDNGDLVISVPEEDGKYLQKRRIYYIKKYDYFYYLSNEKAGAKG